MKASVIGTGFGASVVAKGYEAIGISTQVVSPRDADAVKRACEAPVDLVSIHSPPFLHKEHVMLAIANGRNVHCDKPFGLSAIEAQEMLDAAEAAGILHFLNFEFREDQARATIKRLIDEGAIGAPCHVRWSMYAAAGRSPDVPFGWLWDSNLGGGWIGAYGSHVVDCLRWFVGEIESAKAERRIDVPTRPDGEGKPVACTAEDGFGAVFRLAGEATATVDTSFSAGVTIPQQISVFGTEGALVLNGTTDLTLIQPGKDPQTFAFSAPQNDIHANPFTSWAIRIRDAVREGQQIGPSFADGLACARVLDMLHT